MRLSANRILSPFGSDRILRWGLLITGVITGGILLLILFFLLFEARGALQDPGLGRFFLDASWHPREDLYNLTPMLLGTVLVTAGSVVLALPLGILSSIFCHFYAPRHLAHFYRHIIELLAGIPSVVYGFWGIVTLVPIIAAYHPPGASLLAGILILTVMILPTLALAADSGFSAVPRDYLQGAAALGFSRWATVWRVVIPAAAPSLFTGVLLATGRALGETMAVLMVCGNIVQVPSSFFDPVRTLAANIALEMAYATEEHRSALFVSGLMLMLLVTISTLLAERISRRRKYA